MCVWEGMISTLFIHYVFYGDVRMLYTLFNLCVCVCVCVCACATLTQQLHWHYIHTTFVTQPLSIQDIIQIHTNQVKPKLTEFTLNPLINICIWPWWCNRTADCAVTDVVQWGLHFLFELSCLAFFSPPFLLFFCSSFSFSSASSLSRWTTYSLLVMTLACKGQPTASPARFLAKCVCCEDLRK